MNMQVKHHPQERICSQFYEVINFLKNHGAKGHNKNWHWGRWEWLLSHSYLDEATLPSIGIFLDGDQIVGLCTHDMGKPAYILLNPQYNHLKPRMVDYAFDNLSQKCSSYLFVDEEDEELISIIQSKGYVLTEKSETTLVLDCQEKLTYNLDGKFSITDYHKSKDIDKYVAVIHKGFGNEGEPAKGLTEADFSEQPHQNPSLTVFIIAPSGEYVAHCGILYTADTDTC